MNGDVITSRDNPRIKRLYRLGHVAAAYRREGRVWLEGDHLCTAALGAGCRPEALVVTPVGERWVARWRAQGWLAPDVAVWKVSDSVMAHLSVLESPPAVGCIVPLPLHTTVQAGMPTVVLDRLQDPGNVGSILRSAAAFGFTQIVALRGTVALGSAKVLRAGMGAHFGLRLVERADEAEVAALGVPVLATSSHAGRWLHRAQLPWPCAWLFGHEGQGIEARWLERASATVRIAQPGGQESLNVAAAAAICLHASAVSRAPAGTLS